MFLNICFNIIMFVFGVGIGASIVLTEASTKGYGDFVKIKGLSTKRWRWSHEIDDKEDKEEK